MTRMAIPMYIYDVPIYDVRRFLDTRVGHVGQENAQPVKKERFQCTTDILGNQKISKRTGHHTTPY